MMQDHPILFSGPMVRALLDGRKTQTRRICKPAATLSFVVDCDSGKWGDEEGELLFNCPYGKPGDLLWVRETWKPHSIYAHLKPRDIPPSKVFYAADGAYSPSNTPWRPNIFLLRWASRLTLQLTDIRVQRLQDIPPEDCLAEGATPDMPYGTVWGAINKKPGIRWEDNPWVWALTFIVHKENIESFRRRK